MTRHMRMDKRQARKEWTTVEPSRLQWSWSVEGMDDESISTKPARAITVGRNRTYMAVTYFCMRAQLMLFFSRIQTPDEASSSPAESRRHVNVDGPFRCLVASMLVL